MEPEFLALNFPRFSPEEDAVNETEEVAREPWYASPLCPWNWIYPFLTGEDAPVSPLPGNEGSAAGVSAAAPPSGGEAAPGIHSGGLIPGTTILTTIGGGKKKKAKATPAAASGATAAAPSGSPPAKKAKAPAATPEPAAK